MKPTLSIVGADQCQAGAEAFRALCKRVRAISDATYGRSGCEDVDDRDYAAIVEAIRASVAANLGDAPAAHATGYLRALADMICTNLDGCNRDWRDPEWNPIANTEAGFVGDPLWRT